MQTGTYIHFEIISFVYGTVYSVICMYLQTNVVEFETGLQLKKQFVHNRYLPPLPVHGNSVYGSAGCKKPEGEPFLPKTD